jgi:hypothetical protein
MLSAPVTGLARRRGSENIAEHNIINAATAADKADLRQFVVRDFKQLTSDYSLLHRVGPRVAGSTAPLLMCYNKLTGAALNVSTSTVAINKDGTVTSTTSAETATLLSNGLSAVTQVGRYLIMASKGFVSSASVIEKWNIEPNNKWATVWVRGGAYSRTYKITATRAGVNYVASYTTPSAAYQGVLDTSDIPAGATDYQKQVNDRVNAYNSAVTAWIGTASAAIQPHAIATQLQTALAATALGPSTVVGSTIVIDVAGLQGVQANDGGDSTLMRALWQVAPDAASVTPVHVAGKIIKVQAKEGDPAYYLKAVAKVAATSGWVDVTWEEAAGSIVTTENLSLPVGQESDTLFLIGTVEGDTLYVAPSPAKLKLMLPALDIPVFAHRLVGDAESNKAPYFFNRKIDYLGTFQDRLVVGSGGVLSLSEVGNYFNFYRTSVLTVIDSDPVEVYALGSEDDTIRRSVIFDKSLLLFGDEQQYVINGRVPVTPATTVVVQSSAHEGTTDCKPLASGDFVFYFKQREGVTQVHQLAIGQVVEDTSNSSEVTQQLDDYILGTPIEAAAVTSPDVLLVRTTGDYSVVYTYRYLDAQGGQQRLLDSWSKWLFDPLCGDLIGMTTLSGVVLLYFARSGVGADGVLRTWLAIDRISLLPSIGTKPFLDSQRPYNSVAGGGLTRLWYNQAGLSTAFDKSSAVYLQGEPVLAKVPAMVAEFPGASTANLWTGAEFTSSVAPTNPYRRDDKGIALVQGRLTVTSMTASYKDTAAIKAEVTTPLGVQEVLDFRGRVLGADNNLIGIQPVSRGSVPMFIGREAREYSLQIKSVAWYPMTLTSIEWTGQAFFNAQRA